MGYNNSIANLPTKKNRIYIGVDPGKTGFITLLKNDDNPVFFEMPYKKVETGELLKSGKPKTKLEFDEYGFIHIFNDILYGYIANENVDTEVYVSIEEVQGRGGWSATNNFNFGYIAGMLKMLFITMGIKNILMVRPQKWQSYMRQGYPDLKKASSTGKTQIRDPKAVAEMIVKNEFPSIDFRKSERAKKNDDNKIDSFLIAQYLKRNIEKNENFLYRQSQ